MNYIKPYLFLSSTQSIPVSQITIDPDPESETLMVIDRVSLSTLFKVNHGGRVVKRILPAKYAQANDLVVLIVDTDQQMAAAAVDGIKAEFVDVGSGPA